MKIFRTPLQPTVSPYRLGLSDSFIATGSCFAEAMGKRLADHKMRVLTSPFGAIYNPLSIHKNLLDALRGSRPSDSWVENAGIWHHYDYHSRFSAPGKAELANQITTVQADVSSFLRQCSTLIVTYGTAWVFRSMKTDQVVANCHKMPGNLFHREIIDAAAIIKSFHELHDALTQVNSKINIILTVSPVRHLKDSLEGNSLSKAILRTACEQIRRAFGNVWYFPAYEIMMDDLRDYRFYKSDMIHPTEEAEDYIWDCFVQRYADDELQEFFEEWTKIRNALHHRPFQPSSPAHQEFLRNTLGILEELKEKVDVDKEITLLKKQIL